LPLAGIGLIRRAPLKQLERFDGGLFQAGRN
jgi:hypothetical protein